MTSTNAVRAAVAVGALLLAPSTALAQFEELIIGYGDLVARLGSAVPDGTGVVVGQVEANESAQSDYAPLMSDPEFAGKHFTLMSGPSAASGHADNVGYRMYGLLTSMTPGVTEIFNYEALHWLNAGYLVSGGPALPIEPPEGLKLFNCSWGGTFGGAAAVLRRADFAAARDDVLMINAVNNLLSPPQPPPPPLMSMMYNGLAVGDRFGLHDSSDVVGVDGAGRQKPEIVAPGFITSFTTPWVASVATLLVDTARTHVALHDNPATQRSEVLKAVMLASAKKEATHGAPWTNHPAARGPSRGVTMTPIDDIVGAGTVNVNVSHLVLTGGEQDGSAAPAAGAPIQARGWDLATVGIGESRYYRFHVPARAAAVTFAATWHRHVVPPTLSLGFPGNFNLYLWRVGNGDSLTTLVGDPGLRVFDDGNVTSESTRDNIEYIYVTGLGAGDYALELRRIDVVATQPTYDVAVAWLMPQECGEADIDANGVVDGLDLALILAAWGGCPEGSEDACAGDLDCSGQVSGVDLAMLLAAWG